jgi:Tol biopolymer transport system component
MSDVDGRIWDLLQDRAGDIPAYRPTPPDLQARARRRIALVVGSAALGVVILAVGAFAGIQELAGARRNIPIHQPTPPAVGPLMYVGQDGLVVASSGGAKSHVVRDGPYFWFPSYEWSPDGTRIALISGAPAGKFEGSAMGVDVMNADGSDVDRLASCAGEPEGKDEGRCDGLSWSPDGTHLVFSGGYSLFVVDIGKGSIRQITGCATCDYTRTAVSPTWSPDGSHIAFINNDSVDVSIHVVDIDGSGWRELAVASGASRPDWSPDGARLVFGANDGVHVVDADGRNLRDLTDEAPEETPNIPTWSPDGTRIAYIRMPQGALEVWVMNADGSHNTRLDRSPCCIDAWGPPAWSPDGRSIAFSVSGGTPEPAVYVIGADGSMVHRLPGMGFGAPQWKPTV